MQKKVVGKDADILLLDARASGGTARLLEIAVHSYHGDAVDKRSSAVRWRVLTVFFGERYMECAKNVDFCRLCPLTIDSLSVPLNNVLPVTNVLNLSPDVGVIVLPAVAAFLFSLAALALKRANQLGVDVWQTAFVVNISAGAIYSALWFVGGPPIRLEFWYQPVLIAICLFAGMLAQFMALNRGDVSVAVPVMGLKLLVVAIMSPIVVGEAIPVQLWIAVALSLLGVTMLNRGGRSGSSRSFTISVTSGLLAALSFGAFDLLAAKWGQAWGVGRLLPCVFWINAIFSLACVRGFLSPLSSRSRLAVAWLSIGALLLSLQGLLFIGCLVVYGRAAQTNVTYSIRGLLSVLLVWSVGRYLQNDEGQLTRALLVNRVIGAACLLSAIALAVQ